MKLKVKIFRAAEGSGGGKEIERWFEQQEEEGNHIMVEETKQAGTSNYLFTTIFYTQQDKNIVVNEEEEAPESIVNFKVKKFIEGKTVNFNLFLKELEIEFLRANVDRFCDGIGVVINEFESESQLIMLQELREKGILFTYRNADKDDVFRGTILCDYFSEYYLSAKETETA